MSEDLDGIVVLRSHLEELEEFVRWAYGHFAALDLSENYRAGRPNKEATRITRRAERNLLRIQGYLDAEDISDEQPVQPD